MTDVTFSPNFSPHLNTAQAAIRDEPLGWTIGSTAESRSGACTHVAMHISGFNLGSWGRSGPARKLRRHCLIAIAMPRRERKRPRAESPKMAADTDTDGCAAPGIAVPPSGGNRAHTPHHVVAGSPPLGPRWLDDVVFLFTYGGVWMAPKIFL